MAIAVDCKKCGRSFRVKDGLRGKAVRCPDCAAGATADGREVPDYDAFISHSSKDKKVADAVVAALEAKGVRCWVAPRDIPPGATWSSAIIDGIAKSRVMVLIFSTEANTSKQVFREVERAVAKGLAVLPMRIEAVIPSKDMEYFISSSHWLDATSGPLAEHLQALTRRMLSVLDDAGEAAREDLQPLTIDAPFADADASPAPVPAPRFAAKVAPAAPPAARVGPTVANPAGATAAPRSKGPMAAAALVVAAVVAGGAYFAYTKSRPAAQRADTRPPPSPSAVNSASGGPATSPDSPAVIPAPQPPPKTEPDARPTGPTKPLPTNPLPTHPPPTNPPTTGGNLPPGVAAFVSYGPGTTKPAVVPAPSAAEIEAARKRDADRIYAEAQAARQKEAAEKALKEKEHAALVEAARVKQVTMLLADAKSNDNKINGTAALKSLDDLLKLDPANAEARALLAKINNYYVFNNRAGKKLTVAVNRVGMEFTELGPGEFTMGSPPSEKGYADETPHRVVLTRPFAMGARHVTRGQFAVFVKETGYQTDAEKQGSAFTMSAGKFVSTSGASWKRPGFDQTDDHPVVCVSCDDAQAFCKWLSLKDNRRCRLPTEAEWEYGCRAGTTTAYPWGDDADGGKGWANAVDATARRIVPTWKPFNWDDGFAYTSPAGTFRANEFGFYDMVGNAYQWCGDYYAPYPPAAAKDPAGPAQGDAQSQRVMRGGSWSSGPLVCRAACRAHSPGGSRYSNIGFRCALDAP